MSSTVSEFYHDEVILITGGTGFVGKLLISKLLLSCPQIKKIILLVRKKKYKDVGLVSDNLFDDVIFEKLKTEFPEFHKKIKCIEGDCEREHLGLNAINKFSITQHVTIIFHCAANVEFNKDLKSEIKINVFGAMEIINLAKYVRNLKALVYVSSSYSNCHRPVVEEVYYKPNIHYKTLLKLTEGDFLNTNQRHILGEVRSTYFYSKAAAEQAVIEEGRGLPIAIFRPSAIISTWKEPIPGWSNKAFAPTAIAKSLMLGHFSSILCTDDVIVDMVPGDFTVNALITVAWDAYNRFIDGTLTEPRIYNYVSMMDNPLRFRTFLTTVFSFVREKPSTEAIWYPVLSIRENKIQNFVFSLVRPGLLALAFRFYNAISKNKNSRYDKISKLYYVLMDLLDNIIQKPHIYLNDNIQELWNDISETDQKIYPFNIKTLQWNDYLKVYYRGILEFVIKEKNRDEEAAKKHYFRLRTIHRTVLTFSYFFLILFISYMVRTVIHFFSA